MTDLISREDAIAALEAWGDIYGNNAAATIRALPAAPASAGVTVKPLDRAEGHDSDTLGWTLPPDDLMEIRAEAGEWAECVYLETIQSIALAVEARILAALEDAPNV